MWLTTILSIVNAFLDALSKGLGIYRDDKLREDGANKAALEGDERTIAHVRISNEIDKRPTPTDPDAILNRL